MRVETVRRPGQKGNRKLVEKYGERLICVRYRLDPEKRKRYKTVELVNEEMDWLAPTMSPVTQTLASPVAETTPYVPVRLGYHEKDLLRGIKAIGGHRHPEERLCMHPKLSYGK